LVDDSPEGRLLHRYEMAHDRVLRATLKELMALEKSGADLAEEAEDEPAESEPVAEAGAPTETKSAEVDNGTGVKHGFSDAASRDEPGSARVEAPPMARPGPAGHPEGPIGAVSGSGMALSSS
jgi:hypothetical protein